MSGPILIAGVTGMLGQAIADEILERGGELRATVRPGGYDGEKAEQINDLTSRGLKTFEADLSDPESLA